MKAKDILIENNIKLSIQRVEILNYLLLAKNHPSVDIIYLSLSNKIPTLSKTTIYNTLKLFVKKGIVNEIAIEGKEVRYDALPQPHGHFKCLNCNKICDFDFDIKGINIKILENIKIDTVQFYIKGLCEKCTGGK